MGPFAVELRRFRLERGLRQQELADKIGCERSYVSSLETGFKQMPTAEFVAAIGREFSLGEDELDVLDQARQQSCRRYVLPVEAPLEAYWVAYEFFTRLEQLSARQLEAMLAILQFGDAKAPTNHQPRLRRKDRGAAREKEPTM